MRIRHKLFLCVEFSYKIYSNFDIVFPFRNSTKIKVITKYAIEKIKCDNVMKIIYKTVLILKVMEKNLE